MFFCLCHERGTKEKLLSLQESPRHSKSPRGNSEFFFIPRSWQDEKKNIFLNFFTELKTYRLSYSTKKLCMSVSGQENLDSEE